MREIKFRSWAPLIGHSIEYPKIGCMAYFSLIEAGNCEQVVSGIENNTIMQYTGLKDKNGKEIYEGDIVKTLVVIDSEEEYKEYDCIGRVVFSDGCYLVTDRKTNWNGGIGFCLRGDKVEIIGNIYEDQNLLEKKIICK